MDEIRAISELMSNGVAAFTQRTQIPPHLKQTTRKIYPRGDSILQILFPRS
ncbi:Hypothetical protein FKW44_019374 [Caligus rogercresseyi]|uniref:Uncharacterized protein n=1 Tax=Caligus rogercresseyi TaxID=217165 RepID=A0A7T8GWH1_CALRO|nr:Hypothetical protein FKW44_019374 [Caligus rogercresseyi]